MLSGGMEGGLDGGLGFGGDVGWKDVEFTVTPGDDSGDKLPVRAIPHGWKGAMADGLYGKGGSLEPEMLEKKAQSLLREMTGV